MDNKSFTLHYFGDAAIVLVIDGRAKEVIYNPDFILERPDEELATIRQTIKDDLKKRGITIS